MTFNRVITSICVLLGVVVVSIALLHSIQHQKVSQDENIKAKSILLSSDDSPYQVNISVNEFGGGVAVFKKEQISAGDSVKTVLKPSVILADTLEKGPVVVVCGEDEFILLRADKTGHLEIVRGSDNTTTDVLAEIENIRQYLHISSVGNASPSPEEAPVK